MHFSPRQPRRHQEADPWPLSLFVCRYGTTLSSISLFSLLLFSSLLFINHKTSAKLHNCCHFFLALLRHHIFFLLIAFISTFLTSLGNLNNNGRLRHSRCRRHRSPWRRCLCASRNHTERLQVLHTGWEPMVHQGCCIPTRPRRLGQRPCSVPTRCSANEGTGSKHDPLVPRPVSTHFIACHHA
jgi:hypothetical protein